jgi:hypothetical protein
MKYYPISKLNKLKGTMKIMANEEKLKNVIREEMERVTKMLINGGSTDAIIITKWLQSLQRINDVCKERNRY